MRVVFVHGACVRDGLWWWHRVAELLVATGLHSESVLLPSCGETGLIPGTLGPSLAEDVESVRAKLMATVEPTIAVAHSYGGVVLTEAAAAAAQVRHLLYIASFLPNPGESLASFGNGSPAPYLEFGPDGTFGARLELSQETFLQDCEASLVPPAQSRLVHQTAAVTSQPVSAAAWHNIPSTYLICALDRGTPAELQRQQAKRADRAVEIEAGHHPFLSQPQAVADLILEIAGA